MYDLYELYDLVYINYHKYANELIFSKKEITIVSIIYTSLDEPAITDWGGGGGCFLEVA